MYKHNGDLKPKSIEVLFQETTNTLSIINKTLVTNTSLRNTSEFLNKGLESALGN